MRDFKITVSQSLTKHTTVTSDDYTENYYGKDIDGFPEVEIDTSSVDWFGEFDNQHYDIPFLLSELEAYIEEDIQRRTEPTNDKERRELKRLEAILADCKGWELDETIIEEE